jgi:hypothetical protein
MANKRDMPMREYRVTIAERHLFAPSLHCPILHMMALLLDMAATGRLTSATSCGQPGEYDLRLGE